MTMHDAIAVNDVADAETLEAFLADVQSRAVVIARMSLGNEDDALDAVQDAMTAFVRRYGDRPADERRPLFHRILNNRITDQHRTRTRRGKWWWRPARPEAGDDAPPDPVDQATAEPAVMPQPDGHLEHDQFAGLLQQALRALPDRQRQVFLLRAWEQLDVRETAEALGISTGSVKTHYFRAQARLRELLEPEQ
jgi:RNA polymerase sigma-70 factor (ECF subfamily)